MPNFNIKAGYEANLSTDEFKICYRAQSYAPGLNESTANAPSAWAHYNFSRDLKRNRFIPINSNIKVTYFGFNPLSVFVETDISFRNSSLNMPRPMPFSEEELKAKEIISFSLNEPIKLFDLCSEHALIRHNLNPTSNELVSTDYNPSHLFAQQVYDAGFEGILYPTRQGIKNAVVLFDLAQKKIESATIISRKSVLTTLQETADAERILGIKIYKYI